MVENEKLGIESVGVLLIEGEEVHYRDGERDFGLFHGTAQIRQSLVAEKHDVVTVGGKMLGKEPSKGEKHPQRERSRNEARAVLRRFAETLG